MATTASEPAPQSVVLSYADLQTLPEDGRRYEILEGELTVTPRTEHAAPARVAQLEFLLHAHVLAKGLGEVFYAPIDVLLDRQTVVQPDLVFVSSGRLELIQEHGIVGAPDLVVEIASPSTEQRDSGAKQQLYARYGVAHYWRVDPVARTLHELGLTPRGYQLRATHAATEPFRTQLFPELAIDLAAVLYIPPSKPSK